MKQRELELLTRAGFQPFEAYYSEDLGWMIIFDGRIILGATVEFYID